VGVVWRNTNPLGEQLMQIAAILRLAADAAIVPQSNT